MCYNIFINLSYNKYMAKGNNARSGNKNVKKPKQKKK